MIKNIIHTLSSKFLSAIFSLLIILITSNYLGAQGRGQISLLIAGISFILLFANFVGGNALVYLTSRKSTKDLLILSYIWSFLIACFFYLISNFLNFSQPNLAFHICCLSFLFSMLSINSSILQGKEKITLSNTAGLLQIIAHFFILSFAFLVLKLNHIEVFIYALYLTYLLAWLFTCYHLKNELKGSTKLQITSTLKLAFSLGFIAQMANIFQFLNYRFDVYLIAKYNKITELGIYSTAVTIAESVLILGGSFALVQYAKISNMHNQKESALITVKLTRYTSLLTLLAYIPLFIFPDEFYNFLLGKDFNGVRILLLAICPGIIFLGSSVTISHYFAGNGDYKINAMASLIGLFITLILGYIFIPKYGILAASIVSSISYTCSTLFLLIIFVKQTKTKISSLIPSFSDILFLQNQIKNVRHNRNS